MRKIKLKFMIILIFIIVLNIFSMPIIKANEDLDINDELRGVSGSINKNQEELELFDAINRKILIERYMLAEKNETIKEQHPNWYHISDAMREELDINKDSKIDSLDSTKFQRHIAVLKNDSLREKYPEWIIYKEILAEKLEMELKNVTMEVGSKKTLNVILEPQNAENKDLVWSSNNSKVAKVDNNGNVTAVANGKALITVYLKKNEKVKAVCEVTVQTSPTGIKLSKTTLNLTMGTKSYALKATVTPSTTSSNLKGITWSSSNTKVATVDTSGRVTPKKVGNCVITAKTKNGKKAICKVSVKAKTSNVLNIQKIYQNAPQYANYRFPVHQGSTMAANGCGIVSTTMVLRYLTDKNISVESVATWADNNGHFNGVGSNGSLFGAAAKKYNVGNVTTTSSTAQVKKALLDGRPVVMYCKKGPKALFTNNLHFVVLRGIDKNGKIVVNNPNSTKSEGAFSVSDIEDVKISYYIFDKKK